MPPNDIPQEGSARLSPGQVAVIIDRIRRIAGLEVDAAALQRHLAAVENDETWAGYVERMVVAMGTSAREQADARAAIVEVKQAVEQAAKAFADVLAKVVELQIKVSELQAELKAHRDSREHAAALAADVDKVRITSFYDKVAGPIATAVLTIISMILMHYFGLPLPSPTPESSSVPTP